MKINNSFPDDNLKSEGKINPINIQRDKPIINNSKKKKIWIILIIILFIIFIIILIPLIIVKFVKNAKYKSLIKLNNIKFPSSKGNNLYKEGHLNSYYNFSYNMFLNANYSNFSPISLYNILINVYLAISDNNASKILNDILGLNHDERILFYDQILNNNYFKNSEGEIKISNSAFYNSDKAKENKSYIEQISKTYTECYKLSFETDFNFIIDWINKALKEEKNELGDNFKDKENIAILLISSLYYKQKWKIKFDSYDTFKDIFYIDNNNKKEVYFMKHSYEVDNYYDYEKYISFYDYYSNDYLIQYIIPKSINDNILELICNINFLYENESFNKKGTYIYLSVPKFKIDNEIDFVPILEKIGLEKLFDENYGILNNPFIIEDISYYLNKLFQKNIIELNEDGTTVKSVTYGEIIPMSWEYGLEVKLNRPFIYTIRDINKLPIFIGYIQEPNN